MDYDELEESEREHRARLAEWDAEFFRQTGKRATPAYRDFDEMMREAMRAGWDHLGVSSYRVAWTELGSPSETSMTWWNDMEKP